MHPLDFFAGRDKVLVESRMQEVFVRGESSVEASFVARDGSTKPYLFTGRRVEFEGRTCLVGVGIDITERRQAEQELARLAAIVNSSDDAIISETLDAVITTWNQGAERLFGYTSSEVTGQSLEMLFPPGQEDTERELLAKIGPGQSVWLEAVRRHKDGHLFDVSVTLSPIVDTDGRVIGASKIVHDISARKRAERALQELNTTLETRVVERTAELQSALVRAEAADQIKSAFLATMSHELRTPLNSIIGSTGIVLQGLAGPLTPEQSKQLGMVRGSARHLLDLINDVLDISKIEAGQLDIHPEPFDLPALIERVAASVKPLADKKGLTLSVVVAPTLREMVNDRRRVEQVLLNLLNNAIKFTENGGVTLTVNEIPDFQRAPDVRPVPAVRLRVADTGIGIKPENLA